MSTEKCCKIMIKIIKYVIRLNFPKTLDNKKCVKFNGKMDIFLKEIQTVCFGLEDARCFEFQATCLGPHYHQFEVRHFLKVSTQDKSFFHELEKKLGSPCLRILLAVDGDRVQYSIHLPEPDTGWSIQAEETDEKMQRNSCVTIALKIPLPTADLQTVENAIVQYLMKVLLLHPAFCVSCYSQDKLLFRSRHLEQMKPATTWLGQLKTFCRVYGECEATTNFGRTTRKKITNLPDVTVLYACSTNITKVMTSNHLHVSVRNKDGLPVDVDVTQWCSLVHISSPSGFEVFPGSDKCNLGSQLPDICYPVLGDISPVCCLVVVIVNSQEFNLFLQQNHPTVSSRLTTTVASMFTVTQDNKRYVQNCDMTAAAVGSVLRFSFNDGFQNQCYELLKSSCTVEAEVKFREMLSNTVTNMKQDSSQHPSRTEEDIGSLSATQSQRLSNTVINAGQERDDTQEKINVEASVPAMSQAVSLSPSPHASDLTDEEQFFKWDSPYNLLDSPSSPLLISNRDLLQSLACQPKENEEMQEKRNTEVTEMSQAVSLSSSPNASNLTDEEKFLNWDSPHSLLDSPSSPLLISNTDLLQSLACQPKENEEMQENRNTEVTEMSQAVSLSSSPNASNLTDEEKFLNWDSPHSNLLPECYRTPCPQTSHLLKDDDTDVKTFTCADHKISSISSVSTKDLMDDELFFDWETSQSISVPLEEE